MKTVSQLENTLSDVALLLQQQEYDEALPILGDLVENNPTHREIRLYRLLVLRILVLHHNLTCPATGSAQSSGTIARVITRAATVVRAFELYRPLRSFLRYYQVAQTPPAIPHAQWRSGLAESNPQLERLAVKNKELLQEIDSVSSKLAASESRLAELQAIQDRLSHTQSENHRLHGANHALQQEIAKIKHQLQASKTRLREFAGQNEQTARRNTELQTELVELKQQLHASQKMTEELQIDRERLGRIQSEHQQLQQAMASLRSQLESSEARLAESARQNQQTADGYARLQSELAVLKQQVEEGQAKARALEAAQLANFESREMISGGQKCQLETQRADAQRELSARSSAGSAVIVQMANEEKTAPVVRAKRKRSLGTVPAGVTLAIGSAIAVGFLSVSPDQWPGPKEPVVASALISDERLIPIAPAPVTVRAENQIRAPRPAPRLRGTFKIVRPTKVYSGPSQNSQPIASVGPGMKINVVDSRHGWLEIRSKHGRPPGFVRQEAAIRAEQS